MTLNVNPAWNLNRIEFNHSPLLPRNIRAIVVGSSSCGKTFRVFNMLLQSDFLDYDTLHIFSPSLFQDEYRLLLSGFKNKLTKADIILCIQHQNELGVADPEALTEQYADTLSENEKWQNIKVEGYTSVTNVPEPEQLEKNRKHLLVFDDCMSGPQKQLENFYTRGRHMNCNCIYLTQNWFELPRRTIRANANLFLLFPLGLRELKLIYNDVVEGSCPMSQPEFVSFCQKVWREKPYQFVVIDRFNPDYRQRIRANFERNNIR